jgi:hypothetical protein
LFETLFTGIPPKKPPRRSKSRFSQELADTDSTASRHSLSDERPASQISSEVPHSQFDHAYSQAPMHTAPQISIQHDGIVASTAEMASSSQDAACLTTTSSQHSTLKEPSVSFDVSTGILDISDAPVVKRLSGRRSSRRIQQFDDSTVEDSLPFDTNDLEWQEVGCEACDAEGTYVALKLRTEPVTDNIRLRSTSYSLLPQAALPTSSKNSSSLAQLTSTPKRGWLHKRGGVSGSKNWQKRMFVYENSTLSYYKKENDSASLGDIPLSAMISVKPTLSAIGGSSSYQFLFELETSNRTYYLSANSAQEMTEWMVFLGTIIATAKLPSTQEPSTARAERSGHVKVRETFGTAWTDRYVAVKGTSIYVYKVILWLVHNVFRPSPFVNHVLMS